MANPENTIYTIYAEDMSSGTMFGVTMSRGALSNSHIRCKDIKMTTICWGITQAEQFLHSVRMQYKHEVTKNKVDGSRRFFLKKVKMSEFILNERNWHVLEPTRSTSNTIMNRERWMKKYTKQQRRPYDAWAVLSND
jgi:hypothetical protein